MGDNGFVWDDRINAILDTQTDRYCSFPDCPGKVNPEEDSEYKCLKCQGTGVYEEVGNFDFSRTHNNVVHIALIKISPSPKYRGKGIFPKLLALVVRAGSVIPASEPIDKITLEAWHFIKDGERPPHVYYVKKLGFKVDSIGKNTDLRNWGLLKQATLQEKSRFQMVLTAWLKAFQYEKTNDTLAFDHGQFGFKAEETDQM